MKYYPIKPGDTVQIVLLNPDQVITLPITEKCVDEKISDVLFQKKNLRTTLGGNIAGNKAVGDKVACPICESERIENRFEILDL